MLNFNKKLRPFLLSLFFLLGAVFILTNIAWAQVDTGIDYAKGIGLGATDIRIVIARVIRIALGFLGIIAVSLIMYAGWLWMTSGGSEEKVEHAKKLLINALIGLIIILSSFAIASFILGKLTGITGWPSHNRGSSSSNFFAGSGAIGNCGIQNVYPAPNQKDVPRNTVIVVTFTEEVDPDTIFDPVSGNILTDSVIIFHQDDEDACLDPLVTCPSLTSAQVTTTDNITFIISPNEYLGSDQRHIWYSVYLSDKIKKADGTTSIFNCDNFSGIGSYLWSFDVSDKIDLIPPQVKAGKLFPAPDNERDASSTTMSVQSTGSITVNSSPHAGENAEVDNMTQSLVTPTNLNANNILATCAYPGAYTITIGTGDITYASLERGSDNFGMAGINASSDTMHFDHCNLNFSLVSGVFEQCRASGCVWTFDITNYSPADTFRVANTNFTFVTSAQKAAHPGNWRQVEVDTTNNNTTASRIATAINNLSQVSATAISNVANIVASVGGVSGDSIALTSHLAIPSVLTLNPNSGHLGGGINDGVIWTKNDLWDKPRNSAIKLNFNEAILPLFAGQASGVDDYIRIKCLDGTCSGANTFACGGDTCLQGNFKISNQYRTVEFLSDDACGVNACGETIYCLPANSHLQVELDAANLMGCVNCQAKTPYTFCTAGHCIIPPAGEIYPQSDTLDGITDMAANSLDGNRVNGAEGPASYYDQNNSGNTVPGDNFQWSFFINDKIENDPPQISVTIPNNNDTGVDLSDPVQIDFNKIMLSSSLRSGKTRITSSQGTKTHKNINIRTMNKLPTAFWITSSEEYIGGIPDNEPDWTRTYINHYLFRDINDYRAQVGSGVKDIYQNCYKPTVGPACNAAAMIGNISCCSGSPDSGSVCP